MVKTPEETIFSKELHDLQLQYVGRLFIHFVFSQKKCFIWSNRQIYRKLCSEQQTQGTGI
jgi:hypothetical protein